MTPIGWTYARAVWRYSLAWFLFNDAVKLCVYRMMRSGFSAHQRSLAESRRGCLRRPIAVSRTERSCPMRLAQGGETDRGLAASLGRTRTIFGLQPPGRVLVGPGVTPHLLFTVIAESIEMHLAIAGRPEAGTDSTQRIGDHREMLASHRLSLRQGNPAWVVRFRRVAKFLLRVQSCPLTAING
jgi:hypothetical protein